MIPRIAPLLVLISSGWVAAQQQSANHAGRMGCWTGTRDSRTLEVNSTEDGAVLVNGRNVLAEVVDALEATTTVQAAAIAARDATIADRDAAITDLNGTVTRLVSAVEDMAARMAIFEAGVAVAENRTATVAAAQAADIITLRANAAAAATGRNLELCGSVRIYSDIDLEFVAPYIRDCMRRHQRPVC